MCFENDNQFEEVKIAKVDASSDGWQIQRDDGWSYFVTSDSPIVPTVGMEARFYGRGIGYPVRGLFIDGQIVFYRTEAEEKEKSEVDTYGADSSDWLKRWDEGRSVWSIEMGGLGPGYEQCIHITCAEVLRHLLAKKYDAGQWGSPDIWKRDIAEIEAMSFENPAIKSLGLSSNQWGAAVHLAAKFYQYGPRHVMTDERVKNRHIQVSRSFPGCAA